MRKKRVDDITSVPFFKAFMKLAGASTESLARISGVSHQTVTKARGGGSIKRLLADTLIQTLEEREFVSIAVRRCGPRGNYQPRRKPTSAYRWVKRQVKGKL
jgi:hypothetical protein